MASVRRLLDQSIQLIIAGNGKSAVNFEHSWGDGVAVLRFFNDVYKDSVVSPIANTSSPAPMEPLPFNLSDNTKATVERAGHEFDTLVNSMSQKILETCVGPPPLPQHSRPTGDQL